MGHYKQQLEYNLKTEFCNVKKEIHPKYENAKIICACGEVWETKSTKPEIRVGICAKCHPFFTGKQKFIDTAGRIDKFNRRYKKAE